MTLLPYSNTKYSVTTLTTTFLASTILTLGAFTANAETTIQPPAISSQAQAQSVVNRALEAAGGYEALNAMRNATTTLSVRTANPGQAPTPTTSPELGDPQRNVAYRSNGRVAFENYNGDNLGFRYVRGVGQDWVYLAGQNAVATIDPLFAPGIMDRSVTSVDILLALADNSASIRSSGTNEFNGDTHNLITFADPIGRAQTLYFSAATGALESLVTLSAHPQWGDVRTVTNFGDYKDVSGVALAHKMSTTQAGILTQEVSIESVSLEIADEALFTQPEGAGRNDPFTVADNTPRDLSVEELAKNIFFIPNAAQGYNVIFVNNRDGVTILETPQSPQAARDIITTVNKRLPGKKIKRAVLTHHHFDHSGGLYGFLEASISVVTTPGNEDFVESIGSAGRNIGRNGGTPEKISVKTFDKKRTIGRSSRKIELINVGPNPHAEEIVVAYIPAIKSIFVADLFSARGEELPAANANQLAFAERLEALDLDIETFIPVHGRKATATEFWDSVKRGREAQTEQASE